MEDLLEEIGKDLSPSEARETYVMINKILGNILKNPSEAKFRSLKKENKAISEKLLRSSSAVSLLLALGFDDDGAAYTCPADADLDLMRTVVELVECILVSTEEEVKSADAKAAPAPVPATVAAAAVVATAEVAAATSTVAASKPAVVENPQGFKRRDDAEIKRQEQMNQLQAARAARGAQFTENPSGPAYTPPPTQAGYPAPTATAADADKKKNKPTAFDFKDRGKVEKERNQAAESLQDLRKAQKDKFKDFQNDPNAKKQEAYRAPPSVAPGTQAQDGSWGGWFGNMFGGGSSSGSSSQQKPERRGPNIKGVGDLPKPVRRG